MELRPCFGYELVLGLGRHYSLHVRICADGPEHDPGYKSSFAYAVSAGYSYLNRFMSSFPILQPVADVTKNLLLPHVRAFIVCQLTMSPAETLLDEKKRIIRAGYRQAPQAHFKLSGLLIHL
ncbi:hypothetical protein [Parasutterella excrementihominis]|uniref:hypothetical protein n=1 Tax=Parasutterella excrementihominis TaxID=487175 RepID=UPI0035211DDA